MQNSSIVKHVFEEPQRKCSHSLTITAKIYNIVFRKHIVIFSIFNIIINVKRNTFRTLGMSKKCLYNVNSHTDTSIQYVIKMSYKGMTWPHEMHLLRNFLQCMIWFCKHLPRRQETKKCISFENIGDVNCSWRLMVTTCLTRSGLNLP